MSVVCWRSGGPIEGDFFHDRLMLSAWNDGIVDIKSGKNKVME